MVFGRFALRRRRPSAPTALTGGRTYAIGDVHGRLDLLHELSEMIEDDVAARPPARPVRLIFLGDLIDRGPDSRAMIELGMRLTGETSAIVLKGNHEATLVDVWRGNHDALEMWLMHGGDATLTSYGVDVQALDPDDWQAWMRATRRAVPADAIDWIDRLPTWIAIDRHYFVHAGIRPGVPLDAQDDRDRLWIRDEFIDCIDDHDAIIVHGHTIEGDTVEILPNRINVDTGAYRTGRLSAVAIEGDESWAITTGG